MFLKLPVNNQFFRISVKAWLVFVPKFDRIKINSLEWIDFFYKNSLKYILNKLNGFDYSWGASKKKISPKYVSSEPPPTKLHTYLRENVKWDVCITASTQRKKSGWMNLKERVLSGPVSTNKKH